MSLLSGCSLFIGNVKPVEEKSERYDIMDLEKADADWMRLPSQSDPARTDISDLAFQSKSTASIISLNSACRPSWRGDEPNLQEFSRQLLLGITDQGQRTQDQVDVASVPALRTTVDGKMSGRTVKLQTVVLKKEECVYDLMYVAQPDRFESQNDIFSRFVASLRLK